MHPEDDGSQSCSVVGPGRSEDLEKDRFNRYSEFVYRFSLVLVVLMSVIALWWGWTSVSHCIDFPPERVHLVGQFEKLCSQPDAQLASGTCFLS